MSIPALAKRVLASRPLHRVCILAFGWSVVCYLVLLISHSANNERLKPSAESHHGAGGSDDYNNMAANRELLQSLLNSGAAAAVTAATENPPSASVSSTEINVYEAEPAIDRSPDRDVKDVVSELESKLPNLPLVYLYENKGKNWHYKNNKTCAKFPTIYDLHINNIYWQETETSNGTFYLYGAYLDRRKNNRLGPTVRILSMINRLEPKVQTYCQIWFSGSTEPVIAKNVEYKYIWYKKWGNYKQGIFQPYMMSCKIPSSHWDQVPVSVSVVENICDLATNNLRVTYNTRKPSDDSSKKKFAVCVKGLDFPTDDLSVRMVEWIETLNAFGADKIFLYNLEVHPNVTKVLDYYVKRGIVDVTPLSLPGFQPNMQILQHLYLKSKLNNKRQNEVIPYNDCLYRNIYRYDYVALLDIDEVIVPKKSADWSDMMEEIVAESLKVKNVSRASYNFRNVYFMDSMTKDLDKAIPPYMHMMQHTHRSVNYTKPGQYVKCFHDTAKVLILHNHFPLGCLGGVCTSYPVKTDAAQLQHYRSDCVSTLKKSCAHDFKNGSVVDTSIWSVKSRVIDRSTDALKKLGFFDRRNMPRK